jgi:hypothetical protein
VAPSIGATVSFTVNLGAYQSARYEAHIEGIDPSLPIGPQVTAGVQALPAVFAALEAALVAQLKDNGVILAIRERKP